MKKILILLLFLIPIVYAQDISIFLSKENYNQYETLQAEIFVNLSLVDKLTASNFALLDHNNKTIPAPIFLEGISDTHYFVYFDIPKLDSAKYKFLVKDVKYIDEVLKKGSIYKEFYLSNITSISIYPAIFNRLNSTVLRITNYNGQMNISLIAKELNLSENILLKDIINFNLDIPKNINNFNLNVNYGNFYYLIPVIPHQEEIGNLTKEEIKPLLMPPRNSLILLNSTFGYYFNNKITLTKDSSLKGPFYIKNTWTSRVNNVVFNLTGDLNEISRLNVTFLLVLQPNETLKQYIWLNEDKDPKKIYYSGNIEVKSDEGQFSALPLKIIFIEEAYDKGNTTNYTNSIINKTLAPKSNQTNQNKKTEEKKNKNLVMTFLLIILIIFIIFIYFIFKKNKRKKDFDEFLGEMK